MGEVCMCVWERSLTGCESGCRKCACVWERSLTGCESGCCRGSVHVCRKEV